MSKAFDEARMCGAATDCSRRRPSAHYPNGCSHTDGVHRCRFAKGYRTNHPGSGSCANHLGTTANGEKAAEREIAEREVAKLGIPRGTGDPFQLLTRAAQFALGHLEATGEVLAAAAENRPVVEGGPIVSVEAATPIHLAAIRTGATVGESGVRANVADRQMALDEKVGALLMRFVRELLDLAVPSAKRPQLEAWAVKRLDELATEYERPGSVH